MSLPGSVRASYDEKRVRKPASPTSSAEAGPSSRGRYQDGEVFEPVVKLDKGKGKAVMTAQDLPGESFSQDLERGLDIMDPPRLSNISGDGIGSALSSTDSSIMGEEVEPDAAGEWGPQHPCYPHLNPHVPMDSPEYSSTRIIRIRRDWLLEGDLAPTFSNLYPEILDSAGLSEQEFRRVIEKLNGELIPAFNPYAWRNIVDNILGLVTGWIWDDLGATGIKSRLSNLERWIEKWNLEMEKTIGSEDGASAPKLVPLRRTGYMSVSLNDLAVLELKLTLTIAGYPDLRPRDCACTKHKRGRLESDAAAGTAPNVFPIISCHPSAFLRLDRGIVDPL